MIYYALIIVSAALITAAAWCGFMLYKLRRKEAAGASRSSATELA